MIHIVEQRQQAPVCGIAIVFVGQLVQTLARDNVPACPVLDEP